MALENILMVLISDRNKDKDTLIPCLSVSWLSISRDIGEVSLAIYYDPKHEKTDSEEICRDLLKNLIHILTFDTSIRPDDLGDILSILYYVALSSHYPYAFIPLTFHSRIEEHRDSRVVALIHRLAKKPFSTLLLEHVIPWFGDENISRESEIYPWKTIYIDAKAVREHSCREAVLRFLATAIASMLTAKTRRGYSLSLVFAQSLPLFLKHKCEYISKIFPNVFTVVVKYIYEYYGKRVVGNLGETLRYLMAEPPKASINSCKLWCELSNIQRDIQQKDIGKMVKELKDIIWDKDIIRKTAEGLNSEVIFGRATGFSSIGSPKSFRTIITIATEQWGPLQKTLLEELLEQEGRLVVFYTQASIHNIILERMLSSWLDQQKEYDLIYIPISATDLYPIEKTIEKILEEETQNKEKTLVLSQGPTTIAIPLYITAKKKGFEAKLI